MIGRTYLEAAIGPNWKRLLPSLVVVLERWGRVDADGHHIPTARHLKAPRNVMIRRADSTITVRPFRGLRLP